MSHNESSKILAWDQAIADSQEMLRKVEAKANRLRTNIEVMKEAKTAGCPWPGTQSANHSHESATR
jgi:hypothetical protein